MAINTPRHIGYEPAGLTMHPPQKKTIEGGFILFAGVSSATINCSYIEWLIRVVRGLDN